MYSKHYSVTRTNPMIEKQYKTILSDTILESNQLDIEATLDVIIANLNKGEEKKMVEGLEEDLITALELKWLRTYDCVEQFVMTRSDFRKTMLDVFKQIKLSEDLAARDKIKEILK